MPIDTVFPYLRDVVRCERSTRELKHSRRDRRPNTGVAPFKIMIAGDTIRQVNSNGQNIGLLVDEFHGMPELRAS